MYRLFFVDEHWYLFIRYHQILCERLYKIYKYSLQIAEQEAQDAKNREQSVAEALKLRTKPDVSSDEYYPVFLDIVRNLLDGNMDSTQYEDTLREMFGIHAYISFTLDKVVHNCVRQLQYLVQDETSISVKQIFGEEQRNSCVNLSSSLNSGCGGKVSNMSYTSVINAEAAYQKKAESLLNDQNCYKIISYKNSCRLTIELIDTQDDEEDDDENETEAEVEKWSEYVEKYCKSTNPEVSDDVKSALIKSPIFLTRNAHYLKQKHAGAIEAAEKKSQETKTQTEDGTSSNKDDSTQTTKKFRHTVNETTLSYRRNALKNARKVSCNHFYNIKVIRFY